MKNIVFLAQRIPYPANKGEKIRTFNQIKHLDELGYTIDVLAPHDHANDQLYAKELEQTLGHVNCEISPIGNRKLSMLIGLVKREALSIANFYSIHLQNSLNKLLTTSSIDVVFCTSSAMAKYIFASSVYQELPNKPKLIMDFMDVDSDKWLQYAKSSRFPMSFIYRLEHQQVADYERKIIQAFDACYLISDKEVELFHKVVCPANNLHVLGNGLDTEAFYPPLASPRNSSPVFIFTGVMDYKPNIDAVKWFVEGCWQEILKKYPKSKFIIAGMNPSPDIQSLSRLEGIEVTGFVDDILPYYHQADYFIAPFRMARGVQNKILQAFACQLPVISTPMGAEGINCINGESIVLANSLNEFISAIDKLEADADYRKAIKESAYQLIIDNYSWQGQLKPLNNVVNA